MPTWVTYIYTSLLPTLQSPLSAPNWSNQKPTDNRNLVNLFLPPSPPTYRSPIIQSRARSRNLSDGKWPRVILLNNSKNNVSNIIILIAKIYYMLIITMCQVL